MYTKKVPYRDFKGNPQNEVVNFNLTEHEVFKLLVEFKAIFDWQDSIKDQDLRSLDTVEVVEFYNNLEEILLSAWGELSDDGKHFRKGGRYDFQESALFHQCMADFVSDPESANKLIDGLMPKGLQDLVKKTSANALKVASDPEATPETQAQVAQLRARLAELENDQA